MIKLQGSKGQISISDAVFTSITGNAEAVGGGVAGDVGEDCVADTDLAFGRL